jgi:hypothetical protein
MKPKKQLWLIIGIVVLNSIGMSKFRGATFLHRVCAIGLSQLAAIEHAFGLVIHIGHPVDDAVRVLAKHDLDLFLLQGLDQVRQGYARTLE